MGKRGKRKKYLPALGALTLLAAILTAETAYAGSFHQGSNIPHGTADRWITEAELNNTPPEDYKINEAVQKDAKDAEYLDYFLKEDIQTVSIEIDENNFNYLLQNADSEPTVMTESVTIGDTTLGYCGIKTKGNYTLQHSYTDNAGSDRFSFTVNFGKFITKKAYGEKQNFYGCKKISFNNFFFDKSMMKEFFALKLMTEMGLPTPAYGLAKLYVNGEYYGVYAMIEALDEPVLERYYNVDDKELSDYLCKPIETSFLYEEILADPSPLWEKDEDTYEDVQEMIPTVTEWCRKLNALSEGRDFEGNEIDVNSKEYMELLGQIMDVEEVTRYFATHSWLCQMDNMFTTYQNFGLYVTKEGVATLIPWDYDLSFGCYFPSTSETTANYHVDVMYSLTIQNESQKNNIKNFYKKFPLFHVIYQNEELLEKYHGYMLECSQIAALGGTIASTGEFYEPGYFDYYIDVMSEKIIEAASEKLADNVYYMNRISQPKDVRAALPNLSKIIAMRAVGVYLQVKGIDSTVSGEGCNLETLGNASRGENSSKGVLTTVDASTGIFATAEYERGMGRTGPALTLKILDSEETYYQKIQEAIGIKKDADLVVYSMKDNGNPVSEYTLTIPMSQEFCKSGKEYAVYAFDGEKITELEAVKEDNLYTVTTDSIRYIVVAEKQKGLMNMISGEEVLPFVPIMAAGIVVSVVVVIGVVIIRKRRAENVS